MSHGIDVCEFCENIVKQCRCMGPHERIKRGVCAQCLAKGRRPMTQAEKDAEAGKADESPEGKIRIGDFTISDGFAEGAIWINRQSGEGGSFSIKEFEAHIEEFYQKHF